MILSFVLGILKNKEIKCRKYEAEMKYNENKINLELRKEEIMNYMDIIGKKELEIASSLKNLIELVEKIHNRPKYEDVNKMIRLPDISLEKIKDYSLAARLILNSNLDLGVLGSIALSGAKHEEILIFGINYNGTALSTLKSVVVENINTDHNNYYSNFYFFTFDSIFENLFSYTIFDLKSLEKLEKLEKKVEEYINKTNEILDFYRLLEEKVKIFEEFMDLYYLKFNELLSDLEKMVYIYGNDDYNKFNKEEKYKIRNLYILSKFLYEIISTKLVLEKEENDKINKVNEKGINYLLEKDNEVNNIINSV